MLTFLQVIFTALRGHRKIYLEEDVVDGEYAALVGKLEASCSCFYKKAGD